MAEEDIVIRGDSTDAQAALHDLASAAKSTETTVQGVGKRLDDVGTKSSSKVVTGVKKMGDAAETNGKRLKSFGKDAGSSIGGIGMQTLGAAAGSDALGSVLGTLPLGPVAGAAAALGAAVLLLGNRESFTERQARHLAEAHKNVKDTFEETTATLNRLHDMTGEVLATQNEEADTTAALSKARREAVQILNGVSKGSTKYAEGARLVVAADRASQAAAVALEAARAKQAKALRDDGRDSLAYRETTVKVTAAEQKARDAKQALSRAHRDLSQMTKGDTKESRAYRDKLIEINQLETKQRETKKRLTDLSQESVKVMGDSLTVSKRKIASLKEEKSKLEAMLLPLALMGRTEEENAKVRSQLADVTSQLTQVERTQGAQNKKMIADAGALSGAMESATGKTSSLVGAIADLSGSKLDLSGPLSVLSALGGAAGGAAGQVFNLIGALARAATAPRPTAGGAGGGGKNTKGLNSLKGGSLGIVGKNRGLYTRRTIEERVSDTLSGMERDDSLQDKQVRVGAEATARREGRSGESIALRGDQAVLRRRISENKQRSQVVSRGLRNVRTAIRKALGARDKINAALRKSKKGSAAWKANQEKLDNVRQRLADLYGQESALMREGADLVAEARELGFDAGQLASDIERADQGSSSAGDLAMALAELTPGTEDDTAAAELQRQEAQREFDAAVGSGDSDRIITAAQRLRSGAGGSGGFTQVVNQFFPAGLSADNPQLMQAAAGLQLRIAMIGGA